MMSKQQQSTFFHAALASSEQTGRLINAGLGPYYNLLFKKLRLVFK